MVARRLILTLVVSCLALAFAAPSAGAYSIAGRAWPSSKITYWVRAADYRDDVRAAARYWNRARVGIVFREAQSAASADVVVDYWDNRCGGAAYAGFLRRRQNQVVLGTGCNSDGLVTLMATHELGHVLGLGHENRKCAIMNPVFDSSGTPNHCNHHALSYWLSSPLRADDLRGARALY
jgi:hypothetical protein